MVKKYFKNAFAESGDKQPVSDDASGTLVSYETGYTPEYELDPDTDPAGNYIGRQRFNQILNDVTSNLKHWQENVYPEFIPDADGLGTPFSYPSGFVVSLAGVNYQAVVNGTATSPPSAEWKIFTASNAEDQSSEANPETVVQRDANGTAKFSAPTDPTHPVRLSDADTEATASTIVKRDTNGTAKFGLPTDPEHPALSGNTNTVLTAQTISEQINELTTANNAGAKNALNASGLAPIYAGRAWASLDFTGSATIRGSGGVSSITKLGTARVLLNFAYQMPDENYATFGFSRSTASRTPVLPDGGAYTVSAVEVGLIDPNAGAYNSDPILYNVLVVR